MNIHHHVKPHQRTDRNLVAWNSPSCETSSTGLTRERASLWKMTYNMERKCPVDSHLNKAWLHCSGTVVQLSNGQCHHLLPSNTEDKYSNCFPSYWKHKVHNHACRKVQHAHAHSLTLNGQSNTTSVFIVPTLLCYWKYRAQSRLSSCTVRNLSTVSKKKKIFLKRGEGQLRAFCHVTKSTNWVTTTLLNAR